MERKETDDVKRLSILDGFCGIKYLCPARRKKRKRMEASNLAGLKDDDRKEEKQKQQMIFSRRAKNKNAGSKERICL